MTRKAIVQALAGTVLVVAVVFALVGPVSAQPVMTTPDRYGTAAQAALVAFPEGASVVVLASGQAFPDGLAAAPLAAAYDAPILLTGREDLPQVTRETLAALGAADVLVMGGAAAISHTVTNALEADYQVSRVAGGTTATMEVQVYFINPDLGDPCGEVFGRPRTVSADAPLRPTLEALLEGPTPAEVAQGYGGWFSADTAGMLRSVSIEQRVAHVDFEDLREVIPNASTACGSAGLMAQLNRTVTQFTEVDDARYSILGSQEAFYHWLQGDVP